MTTHYPSHLHPSAFGYLRHVLLSDGFAHFQFLKSLTAPYQCLFGPVDQPGSNTMPDPTEILPRTLEHLGILYPKLELYDWLLRLPYFRPDLPALSSIELGCAPHYGNEYNEFIFESCNHLVLVILQSMNVALKVNFREQDWKEEWKDYDIETFHILPWLDSFGTPCVGKPSPH